MRKRILSIWSVLLILVLSLTVLVPSAPGEQGQEVVRIGEPGPEEVIVVIGSIGLPAGKDYLAAGPEGVIGSSDAVGIEQRVVSIGPGVRGRSSAP